jgi:hypothetical protein
MKYLFNIFIGLFTLCISAQVTTPQPSTSSKVEQVVGLTTVELSYSRPAAREREIFGDLVPFGKKWRTGANANTTISFSDDVVVEGNAVKAGTYAIYTIPNKNKWTVFLYSKTDNWGLPEEWNDTDVAAKFEAEANKLKNHVENFSLQIKDIMSDSAKLEISWEKTMLDFTFKVPTDDMVMKSIKATLKGDPSARDYFNAAVYYMNQDKDIMMAKEWIDTAMNMQDEKPFWMLRQQSLIYSKAGMTDEAIVIAQESMEGAKEAGNTDYIKMNQDSIKEWSNK